MIKTIVLDIVNEINLGELPRLYSSMVRISYNRAKEGMPGNDIRPYLQERFPGIHSWLVHSAEVDGTTIHKSNVDGHKIHFGGKKTYEKYMKGQITKEEYRHSKILPIYSLGEADRYGNRLFDFDLNECKLTFKPNRNTHIPIEFKPTKRMEDLRKLQVLADSGAVAITVRLTDRNVFLSYEETGINLAKYDGLRKRRIMGIDLNPNYIGISVIEFDRKEKFEVIHKEVFELDDFNKEPAGLKSDDPKKKKFNRKRRFEIIELAYKIDRIAKYWHCGKISMEKLDIKSKNMKKGKKLNKLVNNTWIRSLLRTKLHMLADIHGIEFREVVPEYSSIIGNLYYANETTPDMCAAAIELARRAHRQFEKGWNLPTPDVTLCREQWKHTIIGARSWKTVATKLKNSGQRYRVLLEETQCRLRSFNYKSNIYFNYF